MTNEEMIKKIQQAIEKTKRHPFLFLGSGFSRRYFGTLDFRGLLELFTRKISNDEFKFDSYMSGKPPLPVAAQKLQEEFDDLFFKSDNIFPELKKTHKTQLHHHISPFKIAIARYFDVKFNKETLNAIKDKQLQKEVELLKKISVRSVSGVITTNYDNLAEIIFDGFKKYIGQDELLFSGIQEISEIYKIHGCCSTPESILITQEDYDKFNAKSKYLAAKLLTIFIEYPVIFIGYSMNDKNISNIIDSLAGCLDDTRLKQLENRMFVLERAKGEEQNISAYYKNGIGMTQIVTDDFSLVYEAISNVRSQYNPRILRRLKQDVYNVVMLNKPADTIKVVGLADIDDQQIIDSIVIGVGANYYGKEPTAADIYKDILINDTRLDPKKVLVDYMPKLITQSTQMPIFKYIKELEKNDIKIDFCDQVKNLIAKFRTSKEYALYNRTDKDNIIKHGADYKKKTIKDLIEMESKNKLLHPYKAYGFIYLLPLENIDLSDFHSLLKSTFEQNNEIIKNTFFKKMIRLYDYLKYADKS